jgi:hypothetical protein
MRRGHVPPVEAGKAHPIVNSAGKKSGALRAFMLAKVAYACVYFGRTAAVTRSPPCLQRIEATQNSTSLE